MKADQKKFTKIYLSAAQKIIDKIDEEAKRDKKESNVEEPKAV